MIAGKLVRFCRRKIAVSAVRKSCLQHRIRAFTTTNSPPVRQEVFAWGDATKGCTGIGENEGKVVPVPTHVSVLSGENICKVKSFLHNSGALSESGDLYFWGDNSGNKISADGETNKFYPFKIDNLDNVHVVDFDFGTKHGIVLDNQGRVHTWGWGGSFFSGSGALGHGNKQDCPEPKIIQSLVDEGVKIVEIAAGARHNVALDEDGLVWTWGQGEYGRLGNGDSSDSTEPEPLEFFEEIGECIKIRSGSSFSAALTKAGELYTWLVL